MVLDVDLHLILVLGVRDGKGRADLDLGAVFAADANEGADDASGLGIADVATDGMVENRENSLRIQSPLLDRQGFWPGCQEAPI